MAHERIYDVSTVPVTPRQKALRKVTAKTRSKEAAYRRQWRKEHNYKVAPEAVRAAMLLRKARVFMLLGGMCEVCKNNDMRVLQLDHINNDGASERREFGARHNGTAIMRRVLENPSRFQLLCANCHAIKHSMRLEETSSNTSKSLEVA